MRIWLSLLMFSAACPCLALEESGGSMSSLLQSIEAASRCDHPNCRLPQTLGTFKQTSTAVEYCAPGGECAPCASSAACQEVKKPKQDGGGPVREDPRGEFFMIGAELAKRLPVEKLKSPASGGKTPGGRPLAAGPISIEIPAPAQDEEGVEARKPENLR